MTEAMGDLERTLGPVFRLALGGHTMVIVTGVEDARTMFANEGKHPARPIFPALNLLRGRIYGSGGLVSELELIIIQIATNFYNFFFSPIAYCGEPLTVFFRYLRLFSEV